jgi:hypothetical protein
MRSLREDERDEIESVSHFIKYINCKKNARDFEIFEAMLKLKELSEKYVESNIVTEEELAQLSDIDDIKELVERFLVKLKESLKRANNELP